MTVVPASRWTFARVESNGDVRSVFGSALENGSLAALRHELALQRAFVTSGARIAAMLGPLGGFSSGIALIFADARVSHGILSMLRTAESGPFTSSEISMLTFALDHVSDYFAELRLLPSAKGGIQPKHFGTAPLPPEPPEGAFYVLGRDLKIVHSWSSEERRFATLASLQISSAERLPRILEDTVSELTADWAEGATNPAGMARPVPFLIVRTRPMSGPGGLFIGVRVDRYVPRNSLTGAASRFNISPREVQVLTLLLDGKQLDHIAKTLSITSSTVQDHIKKLLDKTGSNNRSELIARILGWESVSEARQQSSRRD